ncbi:MAG: UDP-2,3-diacylglucosamine diphosphatase [Desulfobacterales bacterium]|nr:MAG: UDP-2,3-diacylglucosamine diphosphatase [Desulfobacterales bacterium]
MSALVVSDLHIGSHHFLYEDFECFLRNVPEDHELILNGDIIDNPYEDLQPPHKGILELIKQISYRQTVVWVRGNHDNGYKPSELEKVHFKHFHNVKHRLLIAHGNDFDEIMPINQTFMKAFKWMHNLRVKLGAKPVHVAKYAKKWELFYRFLRKNVMINAANCAIENGYEAVTCGHTHYPEDRIFNGIRYINTGAWTEIPAFYLHVTDNEITLNSMDHPCYLSSSHFTLPTAITENKIKKISCIGKIGRV